ncbi:uncharacterized protein LOC120110599 [Phoenix dactylifera]|uniref:Uncharacterized protein LOC120110599 n=1 Tax=Phoenix dactylifera TaxID=42345 RepID=A0A8B9A8I0_PHODC|nr:uncharacterized protein LOC120110599 [Phoenix dactylifera]
MLQIEPYDGSSDPLYHLESYKALMTLQGATNALLCTAFPATLRKAARHWFSGLKPNSILSFEQLGRQLATFFAASRRQRRTSDSLFAIKQKEGESLKDYISRFTSATWEVRDLDQSIVMSALKTRTRSYKFLFSIEKSFPADFVEMLVRARKYAKAEEAMASRRETAERPAKMQKTRHEERSQPSSRSPWHEKEPPWPKSLAHSRSPIQKFQTYTPLISTRAEILMELRVRATSDLH